MARVIVIGANGQVGAEVCLLLAGSPGIEVVPVVRNHRGSAYLRWMGLPCRHGDIGDPRAAAGLVGDGDLILNFALSGASPAIARRENACLIDNCARYAPAGARLIYYSTQNVYGSANPASYYRWRGFYAREKLRCERDARAAGQRHGRQTWVLRLGHVCGELQGLTRRIRELVQMGTVYLADGGYLPANCVHVPVIVDCALAILHAETAGATYDLVNKPQWRWRDVYQREADILGMPLDIESVPRRSRAGLPAMLRGMLGGAVNAISREAISELGRRAVSHLPPRLTARIHADYLRKRASAEIGALRHRSASHDASDWLAVPGSYLPGMSPSEHVLELPQYRLRIIPRQSIAPLELPAAGGSA